jgi:hypothetical protein
VEEGKIECNKAIACTDPRIHTPSPNISGGKKNNKKKKKRKKKKHRGKKIEKTEKYIEIQ